jgi:hypothetical protein
MREIVSNPVSKAFDSQLLKISSAVSTVLRSDRLRERAIACAEQCGYGDLQ